MSAKSTVLKVLGGIVIGAVGANWTKTKSSKNVGAHVIAGCKIAGNAIKDGFEKMQAGYGDMNADADEITKNYYAKKDAKAEEKRKIDAEFAANSQKTK